jgi:hypothetical protein
MANDTSIPGSRATRRDPPLAQGAREPSDRGSNGEAEPMPPKRPQAPSRARYAAAHPPCTVRFTPEALQKIVTLRERLGCTVDRADVVDSGRFLSPGCPRRG